MGEWPSGRPGQGDRSLSSAVELLVLCFIRRRHESNFEAVSLFFLLTYDKQNVFFRNWSSLPAGSQGSLVLKAVSMCVLGREMLHDGERFGSV